MTTFFCFNLLAEDHTVRARICCARQEGFEFMAELLSIEETGQKIQCQMVPQKSKDLVLSDGIIGYLKQARLPKAQNINVDN